MIHHQVLSSLLFLIFSNISRSPDESMYIGVAVAMFVFLVCVSVRVMLWLPQSPAWPAVLMRYLGGVLLAALAFVLVATCLISCEVWIGNSKTEPISLQSIVAQFEYLLQPLLLGAVVGFVLGAIAVYCLTRWTIPDFAVLLNLRTRKISADELTDARTVAKLLPQPVAHDPRKYFAACHQRGEFYLGIDKEMYPITIAVKTALQIHIQLVGPTRSGKTQLTQSLLVQALCLGHAVVVFDPKFEGDKWLASVLEQECRTIGRPFRYTDLCKGIPQINPFRGCNPREILQLLTPSLGLNRKGEAADFYRTAERVFTKRVTQSQPERNWSLPELADDLRDAAGDEIDKLRGLLDAMDELADIPAVQTAEGLDLEGVLLTGGVLYIAGSEADEDIKMLQPILVQRLVQLIKKRERDTGLHATLFLDEVKNLLSAPVLNALGTIADRNCNLILAHQSLKELVCIDADRQTTEGIVNTNCTVRFCFKQTDPETVAWIESQTGKILVNVESAEITRNAALAEIEEEIHRVQQTHRAAIDANMINQLPPGCAVLIGAGMAQLVFSAPVPVQRKVFTPIAAPKLTRRAGNDLLRDGDGQIPPNKKGNNL